MGRRIRELILAQSGTVTTATTTPRTPVLRAGRVLDFAVRVVTIQSGGTVGTITFIRNRDGTTAAIATATFTTLTAATVSRPALANTDLRPGDEIYYTVVAATGATTDPTGLRAVSEFSQ